MAASSADGVVHHRGEVFDATPGRDPRGGQPGLYVADASIIPSALGNNPLLTITALVGARGRPDREGPAERGALPGAAGFLTGGRYKRRRPRRYRR